MLSFVEIGAKISDGTYPAYMYVQTHGYVHAD